MELELRVRFLGAYPEARKVVSALERLVAALSAAAPGIDSHFRLHGLGLGSIEVLIAPPIAAPQEGEDAFERIVSGLAEAEQGENVPDDWNGRLVRDARDMLAAAADGIDLTILNGTDEVRHVRVTEAAHRHLDAILRTGSRDSIGSVVGRLESVSVHDRRRARLWPANHGPSVEVRFDEAHLSLISESIGARVEAYGRLRRNRFDEIEYLTLRGLDVLPDADDSPPPVGLAGLDPGITGGKPAADYLREMRGQAL